MGVQLNIKDAETVRLARDLAKQLGKTVTETIREALELKTKAQAEERDRRLKDMIDFADEAYAQMPDDIRKMSLKGILDSIYDEDGLPG